MKKLLIGGLIGLSSLSSLSKEYICKTYSMYSHSPIKESTDVLIRTQEKSRMGLVAIENEQFEIAQYSLNGSIMSLELNKNNNIIKFNIEMDSSIDILAQYIDQIANTFEVSSTDKEIFEKDIRKVFKDIPINGTQTISSNVNSILHCQERSTTDNEL